MVLWPEIEGAKLVMNGVFLFFWVFLTHDLFRSQRKTFVIFYVSFHMVYMFSINIQPDHNMASTWILIKVTKGIKSRSAKRHEKNIPVLYFCLVLIDQNKQCIENRIRCLTTVYKCIKQNMFHSYQNENKFHVNEDEKKKLNTEKHIQMF